MKKKWNDIVGFLLLFAGVGGFLGGIHGVSGGENWGGPAIGAGAVANVFAYRVLRAPPTGTTATRAASHAVDPLQARGLTDLHRAVACAGLARP